MMRKIGTREAEEKKKKMGVIIIGMFFIGLLVLGSAGFAFLGGGGPPDVIQSEQADFEPYYDGQFWIVREGGQIFYLNTNPANFSSDAELEFSKTLADYLGNQLYIDSADTKISTQLFRNFAVYPSRIQEACYESCERDLPEKDCSENLISYKESDVNRVYQEGSCVFIEGDYAAVDAFLKRILGI